MNPTAGRARPVVADVTFLFGALAAFLIATTCLRAWLLLVNRELAVAVPMQDLAVAFLIGLRFDLIVASIAIAPAIPALLLPGGLSSRRLVIGWLGLVGAMVLFAGIVEPEFYRQFHTRLNSIAYHYIQEDTATVSRMLWHGFPVIRYLLLWLAGILAFVYALRRLHRLTHVQRHAPASLGLRLPVFLVAAFLVAWGGRGTLRTGPPLRWGDAFHSQHLFANHLALNGTFTLVKALDGKGARQRDAWLQRLSDDEALKRLRRMILTPNDTPIATAAQSILRTHTPSQRLPQAPRNIVLIIMESFSGAFTGALGSQAGITPEFDKLAEQGLLFDRFFSNGTHTHQGMFATVACFPNLPGFEYLMQQPEGQHRFSGLPVLLDAADYNGVYVYNGDFAWDNQEGFFRNQGMTHFVGRNDYAAPVFSDDTWGVSDQDMFDRAVVELNSLPSAKPFFAVLQTLSNHTPYALPDPLPVEPVTGFGRLDEHLTAQRYSDWALGRFFDRVKDAPWYPDTVFVILGDHGFPVSRQLSEIDLLRFRIPMLILGTGIREHYGAVRHTVGTQTDVVPTVVSLLGRPFTHQCWGRDLLSLPDSDPGFGVIKPSGSDQTVALLRGDQVMIQSPQGEAEQGRYQFTPQELYEPLHGDYDDDLANDLFAFVQGAMRALIDNAAGVPAATVEKGPDRTAQAPLPAAPFFHTPGSR